MKGYIISEISNQPAHKSHEGSLIVTNPNERHRLYSDDREAELCCLIIGDKFLIDCGFLPEDISIEHYIDCADIRERFGLLLREHKEKLPYYPLEMKTQITSLLLYLLRHHTKPNLIIGNDIQSRKIQMVNTLLQYLQVNFREKIEIDELARKFGFNMYYLCRTFKELTGLTIHTHINHLRCVHARKLILSGKYTINEVMRLVGFNNASYFSRTYKKHIGCAPNLTNTTEEKEHDIGAHAVTTQKPRE